MLPFLPKKVIRNVQSATPIKESTPELPANPFDNALLASSPLDASAMQAANRELNKNMMELNVCTPVCNYVQRLTNFAERLDVKNVIISKDLANAEKVLGARKKRESGKRGILKGRHSVACSEILELVRAEEKRIESRKNKSNKKGGKTTAEVAEISNVSEREVWDMSEPMVEDS